MAVAGFARAICRGSCRLLARRSHGARVNRLLARGSPLCEDTSIGVAASGSELERNVTLEHDIQYNVQQNDKKIAKKSEIHLRESVLRPEFQLKSENQPLRIRERLPQQDARPRSALSAATIGDHTSDQDRQDDSVNYLLDAVGVRSSGHVGLEAQGSRRLGDTRRRLNSQGVDCSQQERAENWNDPHFSMGLMTPWEHSSLSSRILVDNTPVTDDAVADERYGSRVS
ncbi:Protein of unknown function [Gryllus bimaculatus]|nr:Protein of unknown function [Gryllus bimaculatus]